MHTENVNFGVKDIMWTQSHIFMETINYVLFSFYVASFIYDWQYGFLSLDYSVKMC